MSISEAKDRGREAISGHLGFFILLEIGIIVIISILSAVTCGIAVFLLLGFAYAGSFNVYSKALNKNVYDFNEVMFAKDNYLLCLIQFWLIMLYTTLWSYLFIIPGLIKTYSYALSPVIIIHDNSLTANDSITESRLLMRGEKLNLFIFDLSFIGWFFLMVITFGLAGFYVVPYFKASRIAYLEGILQKKWSKYSSSRNECFSNSEAFDF